LGFDGQFAALRAALENKGFWKQNEPKPSRPKEAVEWVLRQSRKGRSSAIYQQLAMRVSSRGCSDAAFHSLRDSLLRWFPPVAGDGGIERLVKQEMKDGMDS